MTTNPTAAAALLEAAASLVAQAQILMGVAEFDYSDIVGALGAHAADAHGEAA